MLAKLSDRREKLSLKFAKSCAKNELTKELFPLNSIRCKKKSKYRVTHANTDRLKDSAVPYLQRLLNKDEKKLDEQYSSQTWLDAYQDQKAQLNSFVNM